MDDNLVTGETLVQFVQDRMPPREEPQAEPENKLEDVAAPKLEDDDKKPAVAEPKQEDGANGKSGLIDDVRKLRRQRQEADERAAAAEARTRELEAKLNPPKLDEIESQIGPKPKAADYRDIDAYSSDLESWGGKKAILVDAQQRGMQAAQQAREEQVKTFRERQGAFKEAHPDYDDVIASASDMPVAQDLLDEMLASDMGLAVQYHLGQNHDEIKRLNALSPAKRMLELGRLETRLKLEVKAKGEPEVVAPAATRQRQAPPEPVRPIATASGSAAAAGYFDADGEFTGTPEQWAALRKSGKIK